MREKILDKHEEYMAEREIKDFDIIEDFLPSPSEFAAARKKSRITLNLKEPTVQFFKKEAERNNIPYQVLIRDLLEKYVEKYDGK